MGMVQPPNDSSFWFIVSRDGQVFTFDNSGGASELTSVLDLRAQVTTDGEFGMTGMAVHPDYPADNRIFLLYNEEDASGRTALSSFRVDTGDRSIDPASESVLLTLDQATTIHNGGDLAFGTDGMLYATLGEDGERDLAQDNTNLYGVVIRIDVSAALYAIPFDNPFAGGALCDSSANSVGQICPEIFAYGFRNPWRFSIDRDTGAVWVGDVGDFTFEEVDRLVAGGNYGWPIMEGGECHPNNDGCDTTGLQLPVTYYDRDQGVSVIGGYVYRGSNSPNLVGRYIFGDVFTSQFFTLDAASSPGAMAEFAFDGQRQYYAMAQDNAGEVYLLNAAPAGVGDNVYRISGGGGQTVTMPQNLSDAGCFDTGAKVSESGVFDYSLNAPLWSDGAAKRRAFAIPDGSEIGVSVDGDFEFPTGSVLIKHFLNGDTFLETRLLINHSTGWQGYSYEWNAAQTDATLLDGGKRVDVGAFEHIYPSRPQCAACHTDAANNSLGLELQQINRVDDALGANLIDYLNAAGYLSSVHSGETSPLLYSLDDGSASLEQRARSYLHSNCSGCHRPGSVFADIDLRYQTALADTNTCDVAVSTSDLGVGGARRIAPGNPDASTLVLRMEADEGSGNRMPPLGTLLVDDDAVALIRDWISGINACN